MVALELARDLAASGRPVDGVIMLDPRLRLHPLSRAGRLKTWSSATARRTRAELDRSGVAARLGRPGSPAPVAARRDQDLRVAAGQALRRYRPAPHGGAVLLVVAQGTPESPLGRRGGTEVLRRWTPLLPRAQVVDVVGAHVGADGFLSERHVATTAAALNPWLTPRSANDRVPPRA